MARIADGARHFGWVLIGLGVVTAITPALSFAAVIVVVGLVLLAAGGLLATFGWRAWSAGRGPFGFLAGGLAAACGLALVVQPGTTFALVTRIVAGYFVVSGVAQLPVGGRLTADDGRHWVLAEAILSIALGASMWSGWPIAGARALGLLVGIKLASAGVVVLRVERALARVGERLAGLRARLDARL
jgi:uncharacterized membrane protein HdeD (DUF308 family)